MDHHYHHHKDNEFEYQDVQKAKTSSKFNRSKTIHSPRNSIEFPEKPLYLYPSLHSIERNGSIKKPHCSPLGSMVGTSFKGKVKKLRSIFGSRKENHRCSIPKPQTKHSKPLILNSPLLPGTEDRVVIYFTSIRGIRRTFEDCYTVKMILGSYRVKVNERDVSMHNEYRKELQSVMGEKNNVNLPQVFIKGKYIGGAELIKQLNEIGELPKLLRGLPLRPIGYICEGCGDVRFLPCSNCDGSGKYFDEDEGQIKRCYVCNENGLVRCTLCCS
ncbi:hypothetical protein RND71_022034 [Anisodus tanguticus]|uniref:Glutaredoxin domain-containing protein n=1 Tax=Anisodus tanguticus TaxID=243964 RepID=A0AAE1RY51_9SOLA|nr:hypothetical protein RND71_022034 [Anisodus tanguticus]